MSPEEAERWVYLIDEWREGREPTPEELEELREQLERIATTFPHKNLVTGRPE